MKMPRWSVLLCVVTFAATAVAESDTDSFKKSVLEITGMLRDALDVEFKQQIALDALIKEVGQDKAHKIISDAMALPLYKNGDQVDFLEGGKEVKGKIGEIGKDTVSVITDDGGASVVIKDLPTNDQRRLGYNPADAAEAILPALAATLQSNVVDQPTTTANGKPIKEGLNIVSIDAKLMKSSDNYDYVSYKVVLYNGAANDLHNITVHLSFRDAENFEVESTIDNIDAIGSKASATVTGQKMFEKGQWPKVTNYNVTTD